MIDIILTVLLLVLGYIAGTVIEKRHFASIERRERRFLPLPVVSFEKAYDAERPVEGVRLVMGSVVISSDYFKRFLAFFRNLFGGNIASYEGMLDRARREAVLRMIQTAPDADAIVNVRLETSIISGRASARGLTDSVEIYAYGTALFYEKAG